MILQHTGVNNNLMTEQKQAPRIELQQQRLHIQIDVDNPINRKKKSIDPNEDTQRLYHWVPWTQLQKLRFALFVTILVKQFDPNKRKPLSLFKGMAKFIGTRNSTQCRTFAYKMEKLYSSVQKIIQSIKSKYSNSIFQSELVKYRQRIMELYNQYRGSQDDFHNDLAQLKQMAQPYIQRAMKNSKQDISGGAFERFRINLQQQYPIPNDISSSNFKSKQPPKGSKSLQNNEIIIQQERQIIPEQRKRFILQCNYHLRQWLKASTQLNAINQSLFRMNRNIY